MRVDSDVCSKSLGGDQVYIRPPCNFSVKNYTEIFYIYTKGVAGMGRNGTDIGLDWRGVAGATSQ
jgi:hypothetical protein